jgi:hypothetical protein
MIASAAAIRPAPEVVWRRVPDGFMLLGLGHEDPLLLSGTGADLWELLGPGCAFEELVGELAGRYGTEPSRISNDVEAAVRTLVSADVVRLEA